MKTLIVIVPIALVLWGHPMNTHAAETDSNAAMLVHKYMYRPAEELYDIINDPWCQHNLATDLKLQKEKAELRKQLEQWMKECGDEGQPTEMDALNHKWTNHNKNE